MAFWNREKNLGEKKYIMNILLFGAPGVGKGTQAKIIGKYFNIADISMGDMLREMVRTNEELNKKAKPYMDSGRLVPDDIVGEILKSRIEKDDCKNGFILDGYPRNVKQAALLDELGIKIDKAVEIVVDDEEILARLSGRRLCGDCGEPYNVSIKAPKKEGCCDICGGMLRLRQDDKADVIRNRLLVFHEETEPLEEYYEKQNKFFSVDGKGDVESVSKRLKLVLEGKHI